ncbi:carboxypeptidase-like regulatory domain-containing protein [uncultured Tenacibaculum sp.]|uniref:carboxypeptidase-like regulatory domain-containing protein n=1 Tax=uncultured Tenacibaculum sp. TaxID=174713 RepID=UPI00262451D8|nr:carboxypeptidase-like regulatory domain-containing protein [uncultured Tenacibaculum sp.]
MKKELFVLLLFMQFFGFAQKEIKGIVLSEKKEPLEGASVFFNNTTVGDITDVKGEFSLKTKEGKYSLIIAYLGYKTVQYEITVIKDSPNKILKFILLPEDDLLDEVVVDANKKRRSSKEKYYDFNRFKRSFLGTANFSKSCKIENPEVLNYYFDSEDNIFSVEAEQPIIITNKALGYKIYYTLEKFEQSRKRSEYLGYTRYEELKGSKRKKRKWAKNRLIAYNGSRMHFLRSLDRANTKEEGFIIDQFARIPNKKYPTKEEKAFVRKIFKMYMDNNSPINLRKKITKPESKLDSALLINRRLNQKKVIDSLIRKDINYSDITFKIQGKTFLKFNDILKITYTKEKEEYGFRPGKARLDRQESNLFVFEKPEQIHHYGEFSNPSNHLVEGYWAYELFANTLPLDYEPKK